MVRGRRVGTTTVSLSEVKKIIDMTNEGYTRKEIANSVKLCKKTVYNYQIKYNLL